MNLKRARRRAAYSRLMAGFARLDATASTEQRWEWLMAAHVVSQAAMALHLHSHWRMLALSVRTCDWAEAAGQVFRLSLVPLGHALRRLPTGNVGRSNVSAFRPMRPSARIRQLIGWAGREPTRTAV